MRIPVFLSLLLVLAACGGETKPVPQTTASAVPLALDSSQWTATDRKLNPLLNQYFALKDALVEWDSAAADAAAGQLKAYAEQLSKDSTLAPTTAQQVASIQAETLGFLGETSLTEKRRSFHMVSQQLLPMLKEASFRAQPVYQQICPMAFNDTETAFWLSNQRQVVNPYLGKKHPKYASGMLHCGELGDSLAVRP